VLKIAPDTEPQLDRQNAATPEAPTAQIFPPEGAKTTAFRPMGAATAIWLTGIRVHVGAESSDVPWTTVGPPASESPTAQASEALTITIDLRFAVQVAGLTAPTQVLPSVVRMIVHESPTAQPFVGEDIATPLRLFAVGLALGVQTPATKRNIVPPFPTAIPSSAAQGEPVQWVMYNEFTGFATTGPQPATVHLDHAPPAPGTPFQTQKTPSAPLSVPTAYACMKLPGGPLCTKNTPRTSVVAGVGEGMGYSTQLTPLKKKLTPFPGAHAPPGPTPPTIQPALLVMEVSGFRGPPKLTESSWQLFGGMAAWFQENPSH